MPKIAIRDIALIALSIIFLAACAPSGGGLSQDDQVATLVAATLNANNGGQQPTTESTVSGEIPTQSAQGACANSGQFTLVYNASGNIYVWVNGTSSQLTNTGDVEHVNISDDGCRIAYNRLVPNPLFEPNQDFPMQERVDELWVMNSDGSNAHALADTQYFLAQPVTQEDTMVSLYEFDWQPGTYTLVFDTYLVHPGVGQALNNDLYTVSADGGEPTVLLGKNQGGGKFAISPDGQQIAFSTPTNVNVVNFDGSNLRTNLITFPMVITYSEYALSPEVHWAPDSDSLMVAVPPEDGLLAPQNGVYPETTLYYIPLDGSPSFEAGAVQVHPFSFTQFFFSPDNGRIAYLRQIGDPQNNQDELVIALSNGSNELPAISAPQVLFQAWSPDNTQYIYSYNDGAFHLFLGNVNNQNVQPISQLDTFTALAGHMEWIEGTTFVMVLTNGQSAQLSVMDISGSGTILVFAPEFDIPFDVAH
ncbi:MAG TPA: hypothetical protein VLK33_02955 [Terriglobales bacterium]|nr:hypothetical protein [Terriglobales bacterium]